MVLKRIGCLLLCMLLLCGTVPAFAAGSGALDLNGKRIGVQTGTLCGPVTKEKYPEAEMHYYNNQTDLFMALRSKKIDAMVSDVPTLRFAAIDNPDIRMLDVTLGETALAAIFPKTEAGQALRDQYSEFVEKLWTDGTMKEIDAIWFGTDDAERTVLDYESLPDTNGTLRMAADPTLVPYVMIKDYRVVGYDVDIAARFCQEYGYRLEVVPMSFDGVLNAVAGGKADFASSGISVTDERKESMLFSSPHYYSRFVPAVLETAVISTGDTDITNDGTGESLDLNGKRIGVQTGTVAGPTAVEWYPNARVQYFNTETDLFAALRSNKIDALLTDEADIRYASMENPDMRIVNMTLKDSPLCAIFPKTEEGRKLRDEYSAFVDRLWEDGTMDEIDSIWFGTDDTKRTVLDYESLPDTNGTLLMVADTSLPPFAMIKDNRVMGYDIDIAARFCQEKGYRMKIIQMTFEGLLGAVQSGKADFAASCITRTEERAESVLFSSATYYSRIVPVILDKAAVKTKAGNAYTSLDELANKRIGVATGSVQAIQVEERFPNAKLSYFSTDLDMLTALRTGKIDAYASADAYLKYMMAENPDLTCLKEGISEEMNVAFVFDKTDKGRALRDEFNEFLRKIKVTGDYDRIQENWFGSDPTKQEAANTGALEATNGTLRLAADPSMIPFVFLKDGKPAGIDIDTAVMFCKERGYGLNIVEMDFSGIIPAVASGKVDFACSGIAYTEERAESVLFSDTTFTSVSVMAVLRNRDEAKGEAIQPTFWDTLGESFEKTFVREERWKLFVEGILTTLVITVLAIILGTILGFVVFMMCRNGNIIATNVTRFCTWLVQGMPMVVLLMVLYYVIFGSVAINGIAVAIIGFTLTFGSSVYSLLKLGVGTIDKGQYEAAYALGCSGKRTFFKIILPQAIPHIMPSYKGEIISLIKATSIVGYIAVQDLTKMGDIVRSRTYEAFFPLIAITVIYFLLEGLLAVFVNRIRIRTNRRDRKPETILKGVDRHD